MKYAQFFLATITIALLINCKSVDKPSLSKLIVQESVPQKKIDLDSLNKEYLKQRAVVKAFQLNALNSDYSNKEIQDFLFNIITHDYYNSWKGTDWDFNGITETPRKGMIACGYYVTTNLKHASFNLNRYKFAQQVGSVMINSMCDRKSIKRLVGLERVENYLNQYTGRKLFIIAMDNHVGFAIRENDKNYFMHSGFTGEAVVVKEILSESDIIQGSHNFMIGDLLGNENVINQWKFNSRISMVK